MKWILPEKTNNNLIDFLFESRNITDREKFINPSFEDLRSPLLMFGVDEGVRVLAEAIKDKKKIYIHGDFDVDGITATSLMWNFLYRDLNAKVLPFIPNRFTDGYGLSEENIKKIINEGGDLIVTVDCGIKDIELVNKYSDHIDFIISDHHTIRKNEEKETEGSKKISDFLISSKAKAVIHPQLNNNLPFKDICGAFVSWKICVALNDYLSTGIDMSKYLDLVALGTVCDVMPLIDENRIAVKLGIEKMRRTENIGLKMLFEVSKTEISKAAAYHLGFVIGPRLNASGRLETAMDAVRLLTTKSEGYALELARKLDELNKSRQGLTKKYLTLAEERILENGADNKIHFIYGEEWPEGIVGLIAGKLTEKYNRPVLVGSSKDGVIKGSARSIPSFNIANALKKFNKSLLRYGGHAQAAGFSLNESSFQSFLDQITTFADINISDSDLEKTLLIDALVSEDVLVTQTAKDISAFEPFGQSNVTPLFALLSLKPEGIKLIGENKDHAKFVLNNCEFIFFSFKDKFAPLLSSGMIDVAGNLELDNWNGHEKPVFKIKEARASS